MDLFNRVKKQIMNQNKPDTIHSNTNEHPTNLPLPAFKGEEEPYIFISYKHDDKDIVFPLIRQFQEAGYNIWYNDLSKGNNYDIVIANKIKHCKLFITFITEKVINLHITKKKIL